MSQPDLARALRDARPVAPPELRERVRLIAAQAASPKRRVTWRMAVAIAVPLAIAVAAGVLTTRPAHHAHQQQLAGEAIQRAAAPSFAAGAHAPLATLRPNTKRIQRYTTSLQLRVRDSAALSAASKRAVAIAHSFGGYEQRVNVDAARTSGYADIVLRIPKQHVQQAVRRLTALGTIVSENVDVQDLTAQVDSTDRLIARLQTRLAALRLQPQDPETQKRIAALTTQIERLQRGRAATIRSARYATVDLQLTTRPAPAPAHHGHGPLHGLGVAFRWIAIGAIYVLAIGGAFAAVAALVWLAVRGIRRRREDALLSRS